MVSPTLKITFLGTGSAFVLGLENFHSNVLIEDLTSNKKLLVDCGSDARFSLDRLGYGFKDIDAVYVSHIHADHTGGLEWLGFTRYFSGCPKSQLYLSNDIVTLLWDNTLKGGMMTLEDQQAELSTFFEVNAVGASNSFRWQTHQFQLVPTQHVINNGQDMPCYGLFFSVNGTHIYFTADCRISTYEQNKHYYQQATMVFHDCETTPFKSGVHPHYSELQTLPSEIKRKLWLYHYHSSQLHQPKEDGFKGFVQIGQTFVI